MSRFWAAEGFSSDSDDSSDDSSRSSEDAAPQGAAGYGKARGGAGPGGATSQWADLSDESASEDEVRVAKSAKDRAADQLQKHVDTIRASFKINDWSKIQTEFDAVARLVEKSKTLMAGGTPRFFVRLLCDLEDKVRLGLADKASFKKLSATNGRALNRLKLTLKKHNKPYESIMELYRANPIVSSSSESEAVEKRVHDSDDSDSESDSDDDDDSSSSSSSSSEDSDAEKAKKVSSKKKSKVKDEDDDDDDSEDWGSSSSGSSSSGSDGSSSSSDDEDEEGVSQLKGRAKWLKRTDLVVEEKASKNKEERGKARAEAKAAAEASKAATEAAAGLPSTKSLLPEDETLTQTLLEKKCKEIVSSRGRRATDTKQIGRQLEALCKLSRANRRTLGSDAARVELPILMHTVTAQFDLQRGIDDFMETTVWKSCHGYLSRIADILEEDPELRLYALTAEDAADEQLTNTASTSATEGTTNDHVDPDETENERAERLRIEALNKMTNVERKTIRVIGSLSSFMIRLEEEYVKSLQQTSPHSAEYVVRLRDEGKLVELLKRVRLYYARVADNKEAANLAQLEVEHIYYRHDFIAKAVDRASKFDQKFGDVSMLHPSCISSSATKMKKFDDTKVHPASCGGKPQIVDDAEQADTEKWVSELCTFVYQYGSDRSRTRAMLCHIFFFALHDKFLEARDLLLMSKLQDTIGNAVADVPTMILFNRMMVTLGLSAFRQGRIYDSHQCLSDICSGRVRELLAQGVSLGRFSDKSTEQEKMEKRRQIPYHQHINLDLLEAAHLISAMLLEVPNMASAAGKVGGRRRIISRTFRRNFDHYERQVFTSAMPEQTRDFVMCAAKNLMKGEWKKCSQLLASMDVWQLVPGDDSASKIKQMIVERTKLEGLRTYLFAYSSHYDSLSLTQLCNMFEMEKNEVHCVISKMIINQELHASLDQPTGSIVLRKVEPSQLQTLALQFSEKAAALLEANERLLDVRSGKYKDGDWKAKQVGWQDRGDGQRRYYEGRGGGRGSGGVGRGGGRGGRSYEGRGRGRGDRGGGRGGRGGRRPAY